MRSMEQIDILNFSYKFNQKQKIILTLYGHDITKIKKEEKKKVKKQFILFKHIFYKF